MKGHRAGQQVTLGKFEKEKSGHATTTVCNIVHLDQT